MYVDNTPAILAHVIKDSTKDAKRRRQQIGEIFQALNSVLPRIDNLVSRVDLAMSDSIIIQAVYIAIGPFFVVEFGSETKGSKDKNSVALAALGGAAALRGLRLSTLSLIRSVSHLEHLFKGLVGRWLMGLLDFCGTSGSAILDY